MCCGSYLFGARSCQQKSAHQFPAKAAKHQATSPALAPAHVQCPVPVIAETPSHLSRRTALSAVVQSLSCHCAKRPGCSGRRTEPCPAGIKNPPPGVQTHVLDSSQTSLIDALRLKKNLINNCVKRRINSISSTRHSPNQSKLLTLILRANSMCAITSRIWMDNNKCSHSR